MKGHDWTYSYEAFTNSKYVIMRHHSYFEVSTNFRQKFDKKIINLSQGFLGLHIFISANKDYNLRGQSLVTNVKLGLCPRLIIIKTSFLDVWKPWKKLISHKKILRHHRRIVQLIQQQCRESKVFFPPQKCWVDFIGEHDAESYPRKRP